MSVLERPDCPVSFTVDRWLCFIMKGQQPLVIGLGVCVYSSVLPWEVCPTHQQEKRLSQHQLERRPQVSGARLFPHVAFDSHKSSCPLELLPRGCWGRDRRPVHQIFICLLCRALIIPTGEILCWDQSGSCARWEKLDF